MMCLHGILLDAGISKICLAFGKIMISFLFGICFVIGNLVSSRILGLLDPNCFRFSLALYIEVFCSLLSVGVELIKFESFAFYSSLCDAAYPLV